MPFLFAITLFLSASLLFAVQPMIAKILLPLLGGASAVWTTCMVFYQVVLLLGYLYAHVVSRKVPRIGQVALQLMLMIGAFLLLPFVVTEESTEQLRAGAAPVPWLLTTLVIVAGLPFFITSTTGPLLQRWFSQVQHHSSGDPYFLYSASNLGSLIALIGYPVWLEVHFNTSGQSALWRWTFVALTVLIAVCGGFYLRRSRAPINAGASAGDAVPPESISWKRRSFWVLLAFIPSSLMLGVTTYLTTDIASIPLLWVIPLSLYLLTFVLVFARHQWLPQKLWNRLLPVIGLILVFTILCRATEPTWCLILIHLLFFFTAAMVAHGRLASDRPSPGRLTEFYLWMSVGGALGGVFNAIIAPLIFREVFEYPLIILAACALYQPIMSKVPVRLRLINSWMAVIGLGLVTAGLSMAAARMGLLPGLLTNVLLFGLPVILCYPLSRSPVRFTTGLAVVMVAAQVYVELNKRTVFVDRSFFGVSRVTKTANGRFRQLDHGFTAHGRQFVDPERACEPLAYYHRRGPLGTIMGEFNRDHPDGQVGLIGLGAGATTVYAQPDQHWDIYEIDPVVIRIARDDSIFTYLAGCSVVSPRIVEGDARLQLAHAPDRVYQLLILDAFSSDAIPMHLLTTEAIELYFAKLSESGWLAMHLSNRYLDLERVVAGLAQEKGWSGLSWVDTEMNLADGKEESQWVLLTRREEDLRGLVRDTNRIPLDGRPTAAPWTDNHSSLLPIFKW
jgi:hypothetical protein